MLVLIFVQKKKKKEFDVDKENSTELFFFYGHLNKSIIYSDTLVKL